jgi:hypothetical protein
MKSCNSPLLDYPDVLINEWLTNWIILDDFCALDTAFCNKSQRIFFQAIMKRKEFTQRGIKSKYNNQKVLFFLRWIFSRGIKLNYIFLQVQNEEEFNLLNKINLSSTKVVKIRHYEPSEGSIVRLVDSCICVERLVLNDCSVSDSMIYHMSKINQLLYIKLYSNSSDCTMNTILTIAEKCRNLVKIVLIYGCCNGDSQYVDVNGALLKLVQNNKCLNHIHIDLVDEWPQNNNTNLTILRDIIGCCLQLVYCDLKYYGVFDISYLTTFLMYQKTIKQLFIEVTDAEEGLFSRYSYCASYNSVKELTITNHIIKDDLKFENLFQEIQFTEIVLDNIQSISDNVITFIAFHNNVMLKSFLIENCGSKWTHESLNKLLVNCLKLECLSLIECHHLNFNNIAENLQQHALQYSLRNLNIVSASRLLTNQFADIIINLKQLEHICIKSCCNVDIEQVCLFLIINFPKLVLAGDTHKLNASRQFI